MQIPSKNCKIKIQIYNIQPQWWLNAIDNFCVINHSNDAFVLINSKKLKPSKTNICSIWIECLLTRDSHPREKSLTLLSQSPIFVKYIAYFTAFGGLGADRNLCSKYISKISIWCFQASSDTFILFMWTKGKYLPSIYKQKYNWYWSDQHNKLPVADKICNTGQSSEAQRKPKRSQVSKDSSLLTATYFHNWNQINIHS